MLLSGMVVTGVVTWLRYNMQVNTEAQDRVNCFENADFTTYKEAPVLTASRPHSLLSLLLISLFVFILTLLA